MGSTRIRTRYPEISGQRAYQLHHGVWIHMVSHTGLKSKEIAIIFVLFRNSGVGPDLLGHFRRLTVFCSETRLCRLFDILLVPRAELFLIWNILERAWSQHQAAFPRNRDCPESPSAFVCTRVFPDRHCAVCILYNKYNTVQRLYIYTDVPKNTTLITQTWLCWLCLLNNKNN